MTTGTRLEGAWAPLHARLVMSVPSDGATRLLSWETRASEAVRFVPYTGSCTPPRVPRVVTWDEMTMVLLVASAVVAILAIVGAVTVVRWIVGG